MKYKYVSLEPSKNYAAKIYKAPIDYSAFGLTLHWHKDFEFIYVEKGPLKIEKIDNEIILNDGDIYFLNSEEIHSYSNKDENLKFIVVNIAPKIIQQYTDNPRVVPNFKIKSDNARFNIARSLKALYQVSDYEKRSEILKIKALLNNMAYYLLKECCVKELSYVKGSDSEEFNCAKTAIFYMYNHYKKNIPLAEIAAYVGMTPAYFSKYFKDKTHTTFSKYLRKIRLDYALSDMIENDTPVKDAALNNGFPNVNSLIITCKDEYGRTPLEMKYYFKS